MAIGTVLRARGLLEPPPVLVPGIKEEPPVVVAGALVEEEELSCNSSVNINLGLVISDSRVHVPAPCLYSSSKDRPSRVVPD